MLPAAAPLGSHADLGDAPDLQQLVLFEVDGFRVALPIERVREVIVGQQYTSLPGSAQYVLGLINLRGQIITAIDLGVRLGRRPSAADPEHRLVVVDHEGRGVAFAVERLAGMAHVDPEALHASAEALQSLALDRAHLSGVGEVDDDFFVAIDVDAILRPILA